MGFASGYTSEKNTVLAPSGEDCYLLEAVSGWLQGEAYSLQKAFVSLENVLV